MIFRIKIDSGSGWTTVFERNCGVQLVHDELQAIKYALQYAPHTISYMIQCDEDPRFDESGTIDIVPQFMTFPFHPNDFTFSDIVEASGKTLSYFSTTFDIPYRTVQDWHAGRRNPPRYVLKLIAKAMNLPSA